MTRFCRLAVLSPLLAVLLGLPVFCCGTVLGAEYRVLSETVYGSPTTLLSFNSLRQLGDGGYLLAGSSFRNQSWVVKTNFNGNVEWIWQTPRKRYITQQAMFTLDADAGGYLVVGEASEAEFLPEEEVTKIAPSDSRYARKRLYIAKLARTGELVSRNIIQADGSFNSLVCGVKAPDGYVLIGKKDKTHFGQPGVVDRAMESHPWVIKVNESGTVDWESDLIWDGDKMYSAVTTVLNPRACGGALVTGEGVVTFMLRVVVRPTRLINGVRIISAPDIQRNSTVSEIVVQIDRNGKVLAKGELDGSVEGGLFNESAGFFALDLPAPVSERGIRRTWLRQDLKVAKQDEITINGFFFQMDAVAPGVDGGHHVAATQVFPNRILGQASIAYLRPNGELVGLTPLAKELGWTLDGVAAGEDKQTVAVLMHRDSTVKLIRLQFSE